MTALLRAFARLTGGGESIGDLIKKPQESVITRAEGWVTAARRPPPHTGPGVSSASRNTPRCLTEIPLCQTTNQNT